MNMQVLSWSALGFSPAGGERTPRGKGAGVRPPARGAQVQAQGHTGEACQAGPWGGGRHRWRGDGCDPAPGCGLVWLPRELWE